VDAIQLDVTGKVEVLEETIKYIFIHTGRQSPVVITRLARLTQDSQTVECGIFIREYTKHGFTGNGI
jgi:hypothetical protein